MNHEPAPTRGATGAGRGVAVVHRGEAEQAIAADPSRSARRPRVIFVNRFFFPDHSATSQMLSDLAFRLAAAGWRVSIVTSRQRYDQAGAELPPREQVRGVDVHRIATTRFGRTGLAGRAVDYLTFYGAAAWSLWRLTRAGEVVVAKTDPPLLSLVTAPVAAARGARSINWLQDLFPEVVSGVGMGRGRLAGAGLAVLRWLRDASVHGAACNVVLGERMRERLIAAGIPADGVRVVANWADGAAIRPVPHGSNRLRSDWGLEGTFTVAYSGNLGRAHDYLTIVDAIGLIESGGNAAPTPRGGAGRMPVRWLFIGGGSSFVELQAEVRRRGLTTVTFRPYQPREALAHSLSAADVHLVSLLPALEGCIVPSKYYGIAAAGRAAIFIGEKDGEIARLLAATGSGITVAPGDAAGLARAVAELAADPRRARDMGERARTDFEARHDIAVAVAKWDEVLKAATTPAGRD